MTARRHRAVERHHLFAVKIKNVLKPARPAEIKNDCSPRDIKRRQATTFNFTPIPGRMVIPHQKAAGRRLARVFDSIPKLRAKKVSAKFDV